MLPEKDKMDAVQVGEDMQSIPGESAIISVRLTKKILEQLEALLKQNKSLRKDLEIDVNKPTSVSISVDGKVAFQGISGKKPLVNQVSPKDLETVAIALTLKEGESLSTGSDISISINGKEVLKVHQGKVEKNLLISQEKQREHFVQGENKNVSIANDASSTPQTSPTPKATRTQPYQVITDSPPISVTSIASNPPLQQQGSGEQGFQFSSTDREKLVKGGFAPNVIENRVNQTLASSQPPQRGEVQYIPVVILGEQKLERAKTPSRFSQLLKFISNAPSKIIEAIESKLGFNPELRSKDLNNTAALFTAKQVLGCLGAKSADGAVKFTGEQYQFVQKEGSLSVVAKERGKILDWDASSGTLKGNLTKADLEVFRRFDATLEREKAKSAEREKQSSHTERTKEEMELG